MYRISDIPCLFIYRVYSINFSDKIFSFIVIESRDKFLKHACIIFHLSS